MEPLSLTNLLLHSGTEHPDTLLIALAGVVAFALGVAVGVYRRSLPLPLGDLAEDSDGE